VLLLFLGNLRAAFIVAAGDPLSLLATFIGPQPGWGFPRTCLYPGRDGFRHHRRRAAVIVVENVFPQALGREAQDRTPAEFKGF